MFCSTQVCVVFFLPRWHDVSWFWGRNQLNDPFNSKDTASNAFFPLNLPILPGAFDGSEIQRPPGLLFIDPVLYLINPCEILGQTSNSDWENTSISTFFHIFPGLINHGFMTNNCWAMIFFPKELLEQLSFAVPRSLLSLFIASAVLVKAILFLESNSSVVTYSSVPWPT